ncbi:MAG: HAD family hydrolase [Dehalococcoidia bacterium]|nr:HAD family hydrolase [Dehalococcoidia bacterium]
MKQLEVISFDAEGTLVTPDFSEAIWHEAIPALYARKTGLDTFRAKQLIYKEYDAVGNQRLEWYDIEYWFAHLGLGCSQPVIESCRDRVGHYPEVNDVLSSLTGEYKLIVASGTPLEFLYFLLGDIRHYFARVFSSISHFRQLKSPEFYLRLCDEMGVDPSQVVHVGDSWQFDCLNARAAGIRAFYLDRSGDNHEGSLSHLAELKDVLPRTV